MRLPAFDYRTHHDYFVTICIQDRRRILGEVRNAEVAHSAPGRMVRRQWLDLAAHYPFVELDRFIVMPNHLHGVVSLRSDRDRGVSIERLLGQVVGRFKALTTRFYCEGVRNHGWRRFDRRLWQRGFHDRVIRNDRELRLIREYIDLNPLCWEQDRLNPRRASD